MKNSRSLVVVSCLLLAVWSSLFGQTNGTQQKTTAPRRPDLTRDTTLYTMGYSHLDTQWRWDYETTIRKYILSTMVDNFRLIEKYPGLHLQLHRGEPVHDDEGVLSRGLRAREGSMSLPGDGSPPARRWRRLML